MDNAGSHRNNLVRNSISDSGNKFLFSVPYTPKTNGAVEAFFNQIKQHLIELKAFQEYCQHKNELNGTLFRFYDRILFRKLKLNSYWNTKKE